MKSKILLVLTSLLLLSGCGGRKNEFRSGILDLNNQTVAWYTNKHIIGYVIVLPKARNYSDSLVTTKKNVAIAQSAMLDKTKYIINSIGALKNGFDHIYINGSKFDLADGKTISLVDGELKQFEEVDPIIEKAVDKESKSIIYPKPDDSIFWLVIGLIAQTLFTSRMLVQWLASEKAGRSIVPVLFWYLSLSGSTLLFTYAVYRQDPVFIIGQGSGLIVYIRNLVLIKKHKGKLVNRADDK